MVYTWSTSWINQVLTDYLISRHYQVVCNNSLELLPLINLIAQQRFVLVLIKIRLIRFGDLRLDRFLAISEKNYQQFSLLSKHYSQFFNATAWRCDFIILELNHKNLLFRLSHYQQINPVPLCC